MSLARKSSLVLSLIIKYAIKLKSIGGTVVSRCVTCIFFILLSLHASAKQGPQPLGLSLTYDANYTDNVLKSRTDTQSDTGSTLGLNFDSPWRYERKSWDVQANYSVGRTRYNDTTSQDKTSIIGRGSFNWRPSRFFTLTVSDQEQNVVIDAFAPDVESNRTSQSTYTLAPSFNVKLDSQSQFVFTSQYQMVDPHDTDTDNERLSHSLQVSRQLNKLTSSSVSISHTNVDYKYGDNGDSDSDSVNFSLSRRLAFGDLSLGFGRTSNKPENGERQSGNNWSVGYSGQLSRQTLSVSVSRSLTDSALSQLPSSISRADDREVKKNTTSNVNLSRSFGRISANWSISLNESESRLTGSDRAFTSSLGVSRSLLDIGLLRQPSLSANYSYTRKNADTVTETDYQRNYNIRASAKVFKDIRINFDVTHQDRQGLTRSTYEENKLSLGVAWSVL